MTTFIKKKLKDREGNYLVTPSSADIVYCSDGETVATKLRKVENDEFSPTITQMSSVSKVGVGEDIDISDNTQEGYLKSAILKGSTKYRDIDTGEVLDAFEDGRNLELVSVKMPVLSTIGKNLFDGKFTKYEGIYGYYYLKNGTYTCSITDNDTSVDVSNLSFGVRDTGIIWFFDEGTMYNTKRTITNGKLIFYPNTEEAFNKIKQRYHIQIEEGTVATPYEPYKSNILSTSEDVTLRGIGDVQDTLDCLTGEVVQNIGEIVLDGSENWSYHENLSTDVLAVFSVYNNFGYLEWLGAGSILCDKFPVIQERANGSNASEGIYDKDGWAGKNKIPLIINKDRLSSVSVDGLKLWLSNNQLKLQFKLQNKSIKTVDLEPSGTNPTTQPYVWKDGHIQLSSEEGSLLPTLDYSVTTSRGGQILENTKHIAKQDKRIYDLEMLMISSSVEDAYQRLLLQNDVQVMSRMDETHLNPMRYYMLTRLIEEKMYEETDMLNKLDTFFLYGDISSDQYFELMDKIFNLEEEIYEDEEHSEEK